MTTSTVIPYPDATEYAPYFARYIERVPEGDILDTLTRQSAETATLLAGVSESEASFRYAPDKWSIRQVVGHMGDTERIMLYRALSFARGEQAMLPGFDENAYVDDARFDGRSMKGLADEFRLVRAATIPFFAALTPEELRRVGAANNRTYTVRALAWIIAGHEMHHVSLLRERYLSAVRAR
ncbi:MAG: DinB family protein [Gemmatimonadaceae bacterium]